MVNEQYSLLKTYFFFLRLEQSKGLETDHDEPNLSQEIHAKLSNLMEKVTPADMKNDMIGKLYIHTFLLLLHKIKNIV